MTERFTVFDLETNGPSLDFKSDPVENWDNWPEIIQFFGYNCLYTKGKELEIVNELEIHLNWFAQDVYEFEWNETAQEKHNIEPDTVKKLGDSLPNGLKVIDTFIADSSLLITHNNQFDINTLIANYVSWELPLDNIIGENINCWCSMVGLTDFCKITNPNYNPRFMDSPYKWPSLDELYEIAVGEPAPQQNRHNAKADVNLLMKSLSALTSSGKLSF